MTTPASDNSAYAIICDAVWDAVLLPQGEDPDSENIAKYLRRLNQIVVETCTAEDGPRLWLLQDVPITLTANINLYTIGLTGNIVQVAPKYIYDQFYTYPASAGSTRRPVWRISRQQYDMLSTVVQTGPITQIFVDPQTSLPSATMNVYTWLVPDANEALGVLHLVMRQQVSPFIGIMDVMNFPVEWALYLHWKLAHEISSGQPMSVINRCLQQSEMYKQRLIDWDQEHETSILPQPDQRMFQNRRFNK